MEIEIIEGFEDFEEAVTDICFSSRKTKKLSVGEAS
jgi:hypothetical protein